jgi:hypothetical protein
MMEELVRAIQTARDDLLQVSLLLRDHLYETDAPSREQARQAADALIQQARSGCGGPPRQRI